MAKGSLLNLIPILYLVSIILCKKVGYNRLSLEVYNPFDFQLRT